MSHQLHFTATIQILGVNPYVLVTADQAAQLQPGWRKPMPVTVQINGQPESPWHINMMPVGDGTFYLYLHGDVRRASGTGMGDTVEVSVALDTTYRPGPADLPPWFVEALTAAPGAQAAWDVLAPSRQKEIVRYLLNLKAEAARQRALARAVDAVTAGKMPFERASDPGPILPPV